VVNTGRTIGRRRSFKKSKGLGSLSVGDGFFENLIFFPILKDRLSDVGVVNLLKFLVRFHCVYSGVLEEKNVLRYPDEYKLGLALHLRLGILLKTSHKDRRIGRSWKENERRILVLRPSRHSLLFGL
jgi:hypothetical protein